ncbi:ubiquinone/menaquinone biosynthesis methyltransferase [Verrucomicrobium spinosum]|uniref:ubiquinone/menaquinone biosynthesis methyltransferase n=1 Tax=Verrucomicrobium spinosum TaxID=2736 RepID=UPI000174443F|nr:ubiquinone/menaquinone biosynthesis methyltransferase [Verrucomicrobium spinosum]
MQPASSDSAPKKGQDASFVRKAFASIASRYVLTNHVLSLGIDVLWRWRTGRDVAACEPRQVVDLATGSGDLAAEVQSRCPEATVLGVDFSQPMLMEARKRGLTQLVVGDGMNLPLQDACADVVTVAFGLRNMASWPDALREMSRILRPGGHLFVLDFSLPESRVIRTGHLFYLRHVMPRVAGWLTGERAAYEYLCGTIEAFPSGEKMNAMICENGFVKSDASALSFGIASLYHARKAG